MQGRHLSAEGRGVRPTRLHRPDRRRVMPASNKGDEELQRFKFLRRGRRAQHPRAFELVRLLQHISLRPERRTRESC